MCSKYLVDKQWSNLSETNCQTVVFPSYSNARCQLVQKNCQMQKFSYNAQCTQIHYGQTRKSTMLKTPTCAIILYVVQIISRVHNLQALCTCTMSCKLKINAVHPHMHVTDLSGFLYYFTGHSLACNNGTSL